MAVFYAEDAELLASGTTWGRCWVCVNGRLRYWMQPDCLECDRCGHREGIF